MALDKEPRMPAFSADATTPIKLARQGTGELQIAWKDGHASRYRFRDLRSACLCAACVDENTGVRVLDPASVPEDLGLLKAGPVGHYGIQFEWSDGHSTGIYAFDYLRALCPCPTCSARKS